MKKIERKWEEQDGKYVTVDGLRPNIEIQGSIVNKKLTWDVRIVILTMVHRPENCFIQDKSLDELVSFLEEKYPVSLSEIEGIIYGHDCKIHHCKDNIRRYTEIKQKEIDDLEKEVKNLREIQKMITS